MMRVIKRYCPLAFWGMMALLLFYYFHSAHTARVSDTQSLSKLASGDSRPELKIGYRGALVKWGIISSDQFERARLNDPEIAEACVVGLLHPVILTQDVWRSVAYRQVPYEELNGGFQRGSTIFWTPPVKILAGELVFEDKEGNIVRGRCGNCTRKPSLEKSFVVPPVPPYVDTVIAEFTPPEIIPASPEAFAWPQIPIFPTLGPAPPGPFAPPVPPLETPPEIPPEILPLILPPLIAGLPPSPGSFPTPPVVPPSVPPLVLPPVPTSPVIPVANSPEPGTLLLFAGGLVLLIVLRFLPSWQMHEARTPLAEHGKRKSGR
jgi:hypothetical protein